MGIGYHGRRSGAIETGDYSMPVGQVTPVPPRPQ